MPNSAKTSHFNTLTRYCVFALLIFTPLARGGVREWAITIVHIITVMALTAYLLGKCSSEERRFKKTSLDIPILLAFALTVISSVLSVHRATSFWASALFANYIAIFYLVVHTFRSRTHVRQLMQVIIGMAVCLSVLGIFKMFGASFPWWTYDDIPQNKYRLASTFGNPDHLAGYMEMALPIAIGILIIKPNRGRIVMGGYMAFLISMAMILSLSRGGWIGAAFGFLVMIAILVKGDYIRKKKLVAAIFAGLCAVWSIILFHSTVVERIRTFEQRAELPSFKYRVIAWGGIIDMIGDYPLIGVGPGNFSTVFTQYQPPGKTGRYTMGHNDYLHFASELGLLFFPVTIYAMIVFFKAGLKKMNAPGKLYRAGALGGMSAVAAILIHGIVDFNLHIPANAILFTVIVAMAAAPLPHSMRNTTWRT